MTRRYELKRRAERQAETRQRIVEATVDLHTTVGPARTTISAVAERAGVERHTVYAHFPDEQALFEACSTHWRTLHPFPDNARWTAISRPEERLRAALDDVYSWYETAGDDLTVLNRDAGVHELTRRLHARREQALGSVVEGLLAGRPRRKLVRAAIGHAVAFETWHSLVERQGLTRKQAVDAMSSFVASV
jgi:AcrR family transcriptional regulator